MTRFDSFVILADMRTGSNYLEVNLSGLASLACHGEAFNPSFIGGPNRTDILGITREERDRDPDRLLDAIFAQEGVIGGFRFFSDHDPRVIDRILNDPRCAKIVLTRNPAESYVSRKIAAQTGQWRLTNVTKARSGRIRFDLAEFEAHLDRLQDFQLRILGALQRSGQTAFYIGYDDLRDVTVINGIAAFLGIPDRLDGLDRRLKKQNPEPLAEKVVNFPEMQEALARFDWFDLGRTPNFEPRRGPGVLGWVAAARTPLLFAPIAGGPDAAIRDWLSRLDGGLAPVADFSRHSIALWTDRHPGHRSFVVLRHPLARAHAVFCDRILPVGPPGLERHRQALCNLFNIVLPEPGDDDPDAHRAAFRVFLTFLKANLGGQTNLAVDPSFATQFALVQGIAQFSPPDMILREDRLPEDLAALLWQVGREDAPEVAAVTDPHAERLAQILDDDLQVLARDAYQRDYMAFGFGPWRPSPRP